MDFGLIVDIGGWLLTGLGAAAAALHVIAPRTKNTKDDAVASKVDKAREVVAAALLWIVGARGRK